MTEDQKSARLTDLVEKQELEAIPKLMSDRAVRYFLNLPSHSDSIWGTLLGRKPECVANLWLAAVVQHLYNDASSQYEPDVTTKLWVENMEFIKEVRPFITDKMLDALSPWSHVMTHFRELFSPTKKYSIALQKLWFEDKAMHSAAYKLMANVDIKESMEQSFAVWKMLQTLINKNWPKHLETWEEKLGCGIPFFRQGLTGTAPPIKLCEEASNWHALGYFVHCEEPLDVDFSKTSKRLAQLKPEHVELRRIILDHIVKVSPILDGQHPYESSALYRWAVVAGVRTRLTIYDAARALVPENTVEWTNMEALGLPIEDALHHIKLHAPLTTDISVTLPTSMELS